MNYKMMGRLLSQILLVEGVFMLPALFISLYCRDWAAVKAFAYSVIVIAVVSAFMFALCKDAKKKF